MNWQLDCIPIAVRQSEWYSTPFATSHVLLVNEGLSVNERRLVNEHKTGATRLVSLPLR